MLTKLSKWVKILSILTLETVPMPTQANVWMFSGVSQHQITTEKMDCCLDSYRTMEGGAELSMQFSSSTKGAYGCKKYEIPSISLNTYFLNNPFIVCQKKCTYTSYGNRLLIFTFLTAIKRKEFIRNLLVESVFN